MRSHRSFFVANALFLVVTEAAQAGPEPYQARVVVARAQVRSGPGENYYPTDALTAGQTVDVYREEPGGWLAIRPPRESFSWVFGRHVKLGNDNLGEIDKSDVDSRIGSRFSSHRNAVQVRLRKGEVVEILGEESDGGEKWYKIAPPAGEFRWIHATQAERIGPLAASLTDASGDATVVTTSATDAAGDGDSKDKPPITPIDADDLHRELTDIELRLSRMIAAPPAQWNTERLERDTETLLAAAQTPGDREAVKATLGKLDRFASLARRHQEQSGRGGDGERGRISAEHIASSPPLPLPHSGYDAVGVLRPVVSRRPGAPQFALVDDRGQVVSFVTPTPDMNLQPYVGRRIGVTGPRGFIAEFQGAHVTAGRVTPLSERLVR